ncbi:NAD(P)H-binding protein [Bacillus sp. SL00103]
MPMIQTKEKDKEVWKFIMRQKKSDEHLKQSGLSYTIVRPGALPHEEKTGKIEGSCIFQMIKTLRFQRGRSYCSCGKLNRIQCEK